MYVTLDLTLISAKGLKKASRFGKSDVYAVVYISAGTIVTIGSQNLRSNVVENGDTNPTWNFPMRFTLDFHPTLENRRTLRIEIKAVGGMFGSDKNLGEVHHVFNETTNTMNGKKYFINSPVITPSGKEKGCIIVSYCFSKNKRQPGYGALPPLPLPRNIAYAEDIDIKRTSAVVPVAGYPLRPQAGYAYGYPAVQQPPETINRPVNALEAGLIGGTVAALLIADAASGGGCRRCECCGGGSSEKVSGEAAKKKEPGNVLDDDLVDGAPPPAAGVWVAGAGNGGGGCGSGGGNGCACS